MFGRILVICLLCGAISAEIRVSKLREKPEKFKNETGCYIEELDAVIPFEESRPSLTECMEYRCEKSWLHYVSCGVAVALPPFKLVEDKESPYPDCCPRLRRTSTDLSDK